MPNCDAGARLRQAHIGVLRPAILEPAVCALYPVGIVIALQIDSWNSDRQDEAALDGYLHSIAGNVRNDLDEIQRLRELRVGASLLSLRSNLSSRMPFERDLHTAQSTFDTEEATEFPQTVENFALSDPSALAPGRFEELQAFYKTLFQYSARSQDSVVVGNRFPPIVREYDKLLELGKSFNTMIEKDVHGFIPAMARTLERLDDIERGVGDPDVIVNGRLPVGSYFMGLVSESRILNPSRQHGFGFGYRSVRLVDDALHLTHLGDEPWAAILALPANSFASVRSTCFGFQSLRPAHSSE